MVGFSLNYFLNLISCGAESFRIWAALNMSLSLSFSLARGEPSPDISIQLKIREKSFRSPKYGNTFGAQLFQYGQARNEL